MSDHEATDLTGAEDSAPSVRRHGRGSRTTRLVAWFVVVSAASLALGVVATTLIKSPEQVAAEADPPAPTMLTAEITSGTISDSLVTSGLVAPARVTKITVTAPPGLDPIITSVPVKVGAAVGPGTVLLSTADRPLILLYSDVPMVRDLARGDRGPDVTRLQDALRNAGQQISDRPDLFGASTQRALANIYAAAGYAPPTVGGGAIALRSELAFAPPGDAGRVVALTAIVGEVPTGPAIAVSTTSPVVAAELNSIDASKLTVDAPVAFSGTGLPASIAGKVTSIGELRKNANGGLTVPVTFTPDAGFPEGLKEGDALQITVDLSADEEPGLLVPLSAVYTAPDGSTHVYVIKSATKDRIEIHVLATGDGMAKIEAADAILRAGDQVYVGVR